MAYTGGVAALQTPEVAQARAEAIRTVIAKARTAEPLPAMVWRVARPAVAQGKSAKRETAAVADIDEQQQPQEQQQQSTTSNSSAAAATPAVAATASGPKDPRKRIDPRLARRKK